MWLEEVVDVEVVLDGDVDEEAEEEEEEALIAKDDAAGEPSEDEGWRRRL